MRLIRQRPVKASAFLQLDVDTQGMLMDNGAVPVNDIFYPLWDDPNTVQIIYGGYGSGKSVFIVDKLLDDCMNETYFRCFYGRKVYDSVRISVFLTLTDRIEERKLSGFTFSKADNSSMIIRYKNGNSFSPFGADNADKLKSVKDMSHILCEELDQFSLKDFGILLSRLRKPGVKLRFYGAFNTTAVKAGHWIKTTLFGDKRPSNTTTTFCNYTDNQFIDQKAYEEKLWLSAGFNEQKFREIASGDWGADETDNKFAYAFRYTAVPGRKPGYAHVVSGLEVNYNLPLYLSFDFNISPATCLVCQYTPAWVSIIDEIRLMDSDIYLMCERVKVLYGTAQLFVTGDATGRNRSAMTRGSKNFYLIIRTELSLNNTRFRIPGVNPSVKNSRVLTNTILAKHPALLIDARCRYLIEDLRFVTVDDEGEIDKTKDAHRSHLLDCLRYFFNTFFSNFIVK